MPRPPTAFEIHAAKALHADMQGVRRNLPEWDALTEAYKSGIYKDVRVVIGALRTFPGDDAMRTAGAIARQHDADPMSFLQTMLVAACPPEGV